jgi:hypothetical protein
VTVTMPTPAAGRSWRLGAHSEIGVVGAPGAEPVVATATMQLAPRAAFVLVER